MGFYRGPNIVRDGLVLALDAGAVRSYPGSGTTWYDLSGNGNNSTLTNGPTFSNGSIVFDGVDDYSVGSGQLGQDCTMEIWISSSDYNGNIPFCVDGNNYASGPNIYFTSGIIAWNTGNGGTNSFSNSSYPDSGWHNIVITNEYNVTAKLYIDGSEIGTASSLDATTTGTNKVWIGRWHGSEAYNQAASIKSARIYNRALSATEVQQNYNATKSRFGL